VLAEMPRRQHAEAIGEARVLVDTQNLDEVRYKLAVNLKLIHAWICSSNFKKEIE
jgi:hypothetical protein